MITHWSIYISETSQKSHFVASFKAFPWILSGVNQIVVGIQTLGWSPINLLHLTLLSVNVFAFNTSTHSKRHQETSDLIDPLLNELQNLPRRLQWLKEALPLQSYHCRKVSTSYSSDSKKKKEKTQKTHPKLASEHRNAFRIEFLLSTTREVVNTLTTLTLLKLFWQIYGIFQRKDYDGKTLVCRIVTWNFIQLCFWQIPEILQKTNEKWKLLGYDSKWL